MGSDSGTRPPPGRPSYFNPRSPCGERQRLIVNPDHRLNFNPRSPCGERHTRLDSLNRLIRFQSTLPVWGATSAGRAGGAGPGISIHAPRVGSDAQPDTHDPYGAISIHAPRVGSDMKSYWSELLAGIEFQSTLPVWGATIFSRHKAASARHFNPRSPCGERRPPAAPRPSPGTHFNPRSPCGERRGQRLPGGGPGGISIHAPRVGSDILVWIR